jgi:hypothetical protein
MSTGPETFKFCKDCTKRHKECKDSAVDCKWLIYCAVYESKSRLKKQIAYNKKKEEKAQVEKLKGISNG